MILPLPGPLPSDPSRSTPTKTSPLGAAQRQAGLGVMSLPENRVAVSSDGAFATAIPAAAATKLRIERVREMIGDVMVGWPRVGRFLEL